VCDLHHARGDEERKFLGSELKPRSTVCHWFGLKITGAVFFGLASKPVATVSPGLTSKPVVGFLVEPQNQGGGGFFSLGLKTDSYSLVIWTSKSLRRFLGLGLKIKQDSIYRLRLKTDGRMRRHGTRVEI
jgi:hypothetical protein